MLRQLQEPKKDFQEPFVAAVSGWKQEAHSGTGTPRAQGPHVLNKG